MNHQPFLEPLNEEQRMLRDSLLGTVARISPPSRIRDLDGRKEFDDALHAALAELGIWGLGVADEHDGSGFGPTEQVVALEALGRTATSMAVFGVVHFMAVRLFREYGTDAQKKMWLPGLAAGTLKASFCLSEAGGGTDILAAMTTKARKVDGGWRIRGNKMWISGALRADLLIVLARTSENRSRGITMFLVPADAAGFAATEVDTFAINGLDTCALSFDDVEVADEAVLGELDNGFQHVIATLNGERLNAAAVAIGIGNGALESAVDYAAERQAFGRPIGRFQVVQHRLVEAGVALHCAWLATLQAARLDDEGQLLDVASSMAKLAAAKAAIKATDVGMETMGGAGFARDFPMERYFRDARLYTFAPLTNDMISNLLGERWLMLPRSF